MDTRDQLYPMLRTSRRPEMQSPFLGNRQFSYSNDRSRYGSYQPSTSLMPSIGYYKEILDSRYSLHIPTSMCEDEKLKLSPPTIEDKHIWTKQEIDLLLHLYEEHLIKLQDPRVRRTKVWEDIAKQIQEKLDSDVNGCQCNQKFRNMKADYQKVLEHNSRSGSFRKTCKYYERLEKLLTPLCDSKAKDNDVDKTYFASPYDSRGDLPGKLYERGNQIICATETGDNLCSTSGLISSQISRNPIETEGCDITSIKHVEEPPAKRHCPNFISSIEVKDPVLYNTLQGFLKEQKRRDEELIDKIRAIAQDRIDSVVNFLDLFKELVQKL